MSELYGHDRRGLLNKEDPLDPEREVWGAVPILRTKLNRPRLTADLLIRNRLLEHLEDAIDAPLTVITAPAGYGKSVLASSWAERSERNVAWLSLDEDDSDLRLFLTYFVAAIESVLHGACPSTLELTRAPELPRPERIGKYLVNELEGLESPIVLILDDYHRLAPDSPVHNLVTFLLSNRPRQCRLVILTRRDPPLPASLLWTDHRTVQIRLQDLRFTAGETADYFEAESGLTLGKPELENLERQFEGWAIGLRLLSLRLRRVEDKVTFLKRFDGAVPYGREYLLQEVLSGAPPGVRNSLLKSSVLDRFCAPLLDEVFFAEVDRARPALRGEDFIELLQQGDYFGISLDPSRKWYRYHHFFREFLKYELKKHFEAQEIVTLSKHACAWFESEGLIEEALDQALAARDLRRAGDIASRHRIDDLELKPFPVVERWLDRLPREIEDSRLDLLCMRLHILSEKSRFQDMPAIIEKAELLLTDGSADKALAAEVDMYRGLVEFTFKSDAEAARRHLEAARASGALSNHQLNSRLEYWLTISRLMVGEGEQAVQSLEESLGTLSDLNLQTATRRIVSLATVRLLAGDLSGALLDAARVVEFRAKQCPTDVLIWALYVKANAQFQTFHLEEAAPDFAALKEMWSFSNRRVLIDSLGALVLTCQFLKRSDEVTLHLREFFEMARETGEIHSLVLADSFRARLALLQGDLEAAVRWASAYDGTLVLADTFFFLEAPVLTQCRAWIASGSSRNLDKALHQLPVYLERFEGLHFKAQVIEVLVLQAVALWKRGRVEEARTALRKALRLAGPEKYVRPFVEPGPTIAAMMDEFEGDTENRNMICTIQKVLESAKVPQQWDSPVARPHRSQAAEAEPLIETLTNRELDVLELLAKRLQNKEIAERLFISPHTVKDHLKNIFGKLGVSGRREAAEKAIELRILPNQED